jgi:hypothetical protein
MSSTLDGLGNLVLWSAILASLLLIRSADMALAVRGTPGPVTCTGHYETCIEMSEPETGPAMECNSVFQWR